MMVVFIIEVLLETGKDIILLVYYCLGFAMLIVVLVLVLRSRAKDLREINLRKIKYMLEDLDTLQGYIDVCKFVQKDRKMIADRLKIVLAARVGLEGMQNLDRQAVDIAYVKLTTEEKELQRFVRQLSVKSLMAVNVNLSNWVTKTKHSHAIKVIDSWYAEEKKKAMKKKRGIIDIRLAHSFKMLKKHLSTWIADYKDLPHVNELPFCFSPSRLKNMAFPGRISSDIKNMIKVLRSAQAEIEDQIKKKSNKPEENKSKDKKPEDRKPEDRKPEDRKPEDRKPEDRKPEDRKPEDRTPEDR
ncbi:MAG: hypothetical protein Q9M28_10275, partial [Mariprofundaceae bacterium]|nr:hypothetical protein [Mariprofundaceae bacterium]